MEFATVPGLDQLALREVLWRGQAVAGLPRTLARALAQVRSLDGEYKVRGEEVEVRRRGGGEVTPDEWRRGWEHYQQKEGMKDMLGRKVKVDRDERHRTWAATSPKPDSDMTDQKIFFIGVVARPQMTVRVRGKEFGWRKDGLKEGRVEDGALVMRTQKLLPFGAPWEEEVMELRAVGEEELWLTTTTTSDTLDTTELVVTLKARRV